ncbi:tyrosine-protein phosphatase [Paenibacillus sabuli]|nr:CpsB/CapC family capsule biosynthesis tyrosine phosphatase [Paenibacillus sabuli]
MFDIHSHILPGVDDGAADEAEAVAMAEMAAADGITHMIATPHTGDSRFDTASQPVLERVASLNRTLRRRSIGVEVLPGQEVRAGRRTLEDAAAGRLLTLGGSRYLLLELPSSMDERTAIELLHELRMVHMLPVIAHPERHKRLATDPEALQRLVEAGALAQVNAASLLGDNGRAIRRAVRAFVRRGLVHAVASDTHNTQRRPPGLAAAYNELAMLGGGALVRTLRDNARRIAHDLPVVQVAPAGPRLGWLSRRLSRRV